MTLPTVPKSMIVSKVPMEDNGEINEPNSEENTQEIIYETFESLGVNTTICDAARSMGWTKPSKIQAAAIPPGLQGRDLIALAETGSGKTGAFVIPILQSLLESPQRLCAIVLAPTRELAFQISESFQALGSTIGLKCACVVGGIDMMQQQVALARKPHVVIGTPGRLIDHLENTKGFSLRTMKYLVLDEADRMLSMDFEEEINRIIALMPEERNTYLFSATMTSKVAKLQRASLKNPMKIEITHKFATPESLKQHYLFVPAKHKDCYLTYILNEIAGQSVLVFASTCNGSQKIALMLRNLGFQAICLHGQMAQPKRLGALTKFKAKQRNILICTDVASRGLDIPSVDVVINYDIPSHGKEYIHRVGRTARAGRAGTSISIVTQYEVELYQRVEHLLGKKLDEYPCEPETVLVLLERVAEAQRIATIEMKEMERNGTSGKKGDYKGHKATRNKEGKGSNTSSGHGGFKKPRSKGDGGSGGFKKQRRS